MRQRILIVGILAAFAFSGCVSSAIIKGETFKPSIRTGCDQYRKHRDFMRCVSEIVKTAEAREFSDLKIKRLNRNRPGGWFSDIVYDQYEVRRHDLVHVFTVSYPRPTPIKQLLITVIKVMGGVLVGIALSI